VTSQSRIWCQRRPAFESDLAGHLFVRGAARNSGDPRQLKKLTAQLLQARNHTNRLGSDSLGTEEVYMRGLEADKLESEFAGLSRELRLGETCEASGIEAPSAEPRSGR
jgi:hypothetical protein